MEFSKRDQKILEDLRKAKSIYRDLGEVLDFYETLFQKQFTFKSKMERMDAARYWERREINLRDLSGGSPQIRFEELDLQPLPLLALYQNIVSLLVPYTGTVYDPKTEPAPEKIIEYAREIFLSRGPLVISGASEDLIRTASGFVLAPYLQLACERVLSRIPPNSWHREYCPVCGGGPSFAALSSESGSRTLLCGRCFGEWSYDRIGCPFCRDKISQTYYPGDEPKYRLYVCEACNRYLKTVDIREAGAELCLPVESIVTVSMDLAAQEKGHKFY